MSALAIMNSAFRMLLAAMMRARWVAGVRNCISAYIGTENRPAKSDIRPRSIITRQGAPTATNCSTVSVAEAGSPRDAKYRSTANTVMPIAPSGRG